MELEILPDTPNDTVATSATVKFHISLNVRDLARSIHFYRVLFDREPAKQFADYAKFELENPALVLSLEPQLHATGGSLNHLGFRVASAEELVAMQHRLESAGLPTTREDGVACCHAKQTKFWIADPDGNNLEIYILEEDIEHRGIAQAPQPVPDQHPAPAQPIVWEHYLGTPFPKSIPLGNNSADEVLLRGTFNARMAPEKLANVVGEARRVLRNGGKVIVHGLAANVAVDDPPALPGPAAAVQVVPAESQPIALLSAAGFVEIRITKLSDNPVFQQNGVHYREMLIEARKHSPSPFAIRQTVIYLGPAQSITDSRGTVYPIGQRTRVTSDVAELLRTGSMADSFIFLPPGEI